MRPWPRVWNGGPAEPTGAPALVVEVEVETRPESNGRDRFARGKRTQAARQAILDEVAVALAQGQRLPEAGPWCVRLTRFTSARLLDVGNLWSALKAVEDAVAAVLQVDDGSPAFAATVAQAKRPGGFAVRVEVWGGDAAPPMRHRCGCTDADAGECAGPGAGIRASWGAAPCSCACHGGSPC